MKKVLLVLICINAFSCQKYLEIRPDKELVVLSTFQDAQAMLDYNDVFNKVGPFSIHAAADDFYVLNEDLQSVSQSDYNNYIWEKDIFNLYDRNDWSKPYTSVYYANIVLDALKADELKGSPEQLDIIKGQSLFLRSFAFYNLLQIFARPYFFDGQNGEELGIPLRLSSDFNLPTTRSTVKESYERLIGDLIISSDLLPESVSIKTRVSRYASYALLSRIYLNMEDYESALHYANAVLEERKMLLDYNDLDPELAYPFEIFNDEVIFHSETPGYGILAAPVCKIDSTLFDSYDEADLRKNLFFNQNNDGSHSFRGSYAGSTQLFNGLAIEELYLIQSESNIRLGNVGEGIRSLNSLLLKRYKKNMFVPLEIIDADKALEKVLLEKRKEMVLRDTRWPDLRRLNKSLETAVTIRRFSDSQEYILLPDDERYVFQIPLKVIKMTGIEQN